MLCYSGGILCLFTAFIKNPQLKLKNNNREIFFVKQTEVILGVNDKMLYDVYFEPNWMGIVKADLIIQVSGIDQEYIIQLRGYGLEPVLRISDQYLNFPNVLPYVDDADKFIKIWNVGKIPLEFCFSDYDKYYYISFVIAEFNNITNFLTKTVKSKKKTKSYVQFVVIWINQFCIYL